MIKMEYQRTVQCKCTKESVSVDCYGSENVSMGLCHNCGAYHLARPIEIIDFETLDIMTIYEQDIIHTFKSRMLYIVSYIRNLFEME